MRRLHYAALWERTTDCDGDSGVRCTSRRGLAPALAKNNDHHHSWCGYFYDRMESLTRSLGNLGSRLTGRVDSLSLRVDALAATVGGQASTALSARIEEVASKAASDITSLTAKLDPKAAELDGKIQGQLGVLNQGLTAVNTSVGNLTSSVETLAGRVNTLEAALQNGGGTSGGGRVVVDFNEKKIGDFVGLDAFSIPLVAMSDEAGHSFLLQVGPNSLIGDVYFTGGSCSGTAYVFSSEKKSMSLAGVRNGVVYVTNAHVDPATVSVMSVSSDFGPEFCNPAHFTITAVPVTGSFQLVAAPPFLVK